MVIELGIQIYSLDLGFEIVSNFAVKNELFTAVNALMQKRGVMVDITLLAEKAKAGDKEALLALIMAQKLDYYRLAYTYMGNQEDAMDAIEDMIVVVYEKIAHLKKIEAFYSWSKTILVNSCRKLLRSRKKIIPMEALPTEQSLLSQPEFSNMLQQITLEKHISKLNLKQQEAIKLHYYLDMDYQAIAKLLGIPLGTVKSRIAAGVKQLSISLGGEELE